MAKLWRDLIGASEQFSFGQRMYHVTVIFGALMCFFGASMEFSSVIAQIFWIGFGLIWMGFYYLSRFKNKHQLVAGISFALLIFVFFPYSWFFSNGSYGVFAYYAILSIAIMSMILQGRLRIVLVLAFIGVVGVLIVLDARYGGLIVPYEKALPLLDVAIHLPVVLAMTAAFVWVYSNTYMDEKEKREKYAKAIEEHYEQQLYYMENLEQLIYKLKSERHDFNHHLGVVYGLLEGDEINSAKEYTNNLVVTAADYRNIVNLPYPMVRAMLNYKLSSVMEKGIELRLDVKVPSKLRINEYDLTIVLGNLIDNAVEACKALDNGTGFIDLRLSFKPNYLIIQVENPMQANISDSDFGLNTTKKNAENHGFGLKNIEYIVNKHKGFIKIEPREAIFSVHIALLINT